MGGKERRRRRRRENRKKAQADAIRARRRARHMLRLAGQHLHLCTATTTHQFTATDQVRTAGFAPRTAHSSSVSCAELHTPRTHMPVSINHRRFLIRIHTHRILPHNYTYHGLAALTVHSRANLCYRAWTVPGLLVGLRLQQACFLPRLRALLRTLLPRTFAYTYRARTTAKRSAIPSIYLSHFLAYCENTGARSNRRRAFQ